MRRIIIAETVMLAVGGHNSIFARGSIELHQAWSSEEILAMQAARKADLIIADTALPEMGGAELCSAIRSDPGLKDVSIILVCGLAEAASAQIKDAKANALIVKPINPIELFSKMSELLIVPQRQDIRSLLHVSVNGREGRSAFLGVTHNISISGLLLETDQLLKKGDRVTCTVSISSRKITTECIIVRAARIAEGRYRYGAKFHNLDTKSLILIEQFVKGGVKH